MQIYFYYKGNYDQYVKTREELEENQMKRFNWEQDQIAHMKVNKGLSRHCCVVPWTQQLSQLFHTGNMVKYNLLGMIYSHSCVYIHHSELHSPVWSRLCKTGTTGSEQREDATEDGGIWLNWKSCEWQGTNGHCECNEGCKGCFDPVTHTGLDALC